MIGLAHVEADGARIKVVGVGGGGGNAVNNMISRGLGGVDFIAANTDKQALDHNLSGLKLQIGKEVTRGLGAGADPETGRKAVEESYAQVAEAISGCDMIFITAGMGGGTGTGAAPVMAKIAQEQGSLVVSIVTKPFSWEGNKRKKLADQGIDELRKHVDALIVIPNQRLLEIIDKDTSFKEAYQKVDEVLYNATRGISDIIANHGVVNVDFADVKTIMKGMGDALMGIGSASGENRAAKATEMALNSPLLDGISIAGAKGVLVNITGGADLKMHEISEAVTIVEQAAGEDVNLIHGVVVNPDMSDEISVTVVATGFAKLKEEPQEAKPEREPEIKRLQTEYKPYDRKPDYVFGSGAPKGTKALMDYDKPAFVRRGSSGAILGEQGEARAEKLKEFAPTPELYQELEKPAFLRKIMD